MPLPHLLRPYFVPVGQVARALGATSETIVASAMHHGISVQVFDGEVCVDKRWVDDMTRQREAERAQSIETFRAGMKERGLSDATIQQEIAAYIDLRQRNGL